MTDPDYRRQRRYMNICKRMLGPESKIKEPDIRCIWVFNRMPKSFPDSPYLGIIAMPGSGEVIVFTVLKANEYFRWANNLVLKYQWTDHRRQKHPVRKSINGPMGKPLKGDSRIKKLHTVRTESGLDILMKI